MQKICLIFRISTPFSTDNNCESGVLKLDNKNRFDQNNQNKNDQNRNDQNRNDQNKNNQNKNDQNKNNR